MDADHFEQFQKELATCKTHEARVSVVEAFLEYVRQHDPEEVEAQRCCRVAIAKFLDTLAGPGRNTLLLETCDRLRRFGLRDPIIAASAAQALVDLRGTRIGGPLASMTLLQGWVEPDYPDRAHLACANSMRGRAHKDLFFEARLARQHSLAAQHLRASFLAYYTAYQMTQDSLTAKDEKERSWLWRTPAVNLVTLGAILNRDGITLQDPGLGDIEPWLDTHVETLKKRIEARLDRDEGEPYDYASLAEIEIARGGEVLLAEKRLEQYLAALRKGPVQDAQPDFIFAGVARQFSEILGHPKDGFEHLRVGLRAASFDELGFAILSQEAMNETHGLSMETLDRGRELQANWTGDAQQPIETLMSLVEAARCVAEIFVNNRRLGTGFAIKLSDLCEVKCDDVVLLTNAHVSTWDIPYGDSVDPSRAEARFHYAEGQPRFALGRGWTNNPAETGEGWLDFSILKLEGEVSTPPTLPIEKLNASPAGGENEGVEKVYVIGFPLGTTTMSVALEHNKIVTPMTETTAKREILYKSATEKGSSGSPVLLHRGGEFRVVAVHYAGDENVRANAGVLLSRIQEYIEAKIAPGDGLVV